MTPLAKKLALPPPTTCRELEDQEDNLPAADRTAPEAAS